MACLAVVLTGHGLAHPQLAVLTAAQLVGKHYFAARLVDIGDDVGDQRPDQLLSGPGW